MIRDLRKKEGKVCEKYRADLFATCFGHVDTHITTFGETEGGYKGYINPS
jgi:hypothetical protein